MVNPLGISVVGKNIDDKRTISCGNRYYLLPTILQT